MSDPEDPTAGSGAQDASASAPEADGQGFGGEETSLLERIDPQVQTWVIVGVIAAFLAATAYALLAELTDKQQAVYQGLALAATGILGGGVGVRTQRSKVEAAQGKADQATELERERATRRLSEARAKAIAVASDPRRNAPVVVAPPPDPDRPNLESSLLKATRGTDHIVWAMGDPHDTPPPLIDSSTLVKEIEAAFDTA